MEIKIKSIGIAVLIVTSLRATMALCISDPSPPCQAFWTTEVVFTGTVTRVFYSDIYQKGEGENRWNYRDRVAHFSVESVFRGKLGAEVDVIATEFMPIPITFADGSLGSKAMAESDCEYKFKEGERYLVYARFRKVNDGSLMVPYNRTRPLAQAAEDLDFIRGLEGSLSGGRIFGQVKQRTRDLESNAKLKSMSPLANVKILVEGVGRHYEAVTDVDGQYELKGLPPGEYSVQAEFPFYLASYSARKVYVVDRGCAQSDFFTEADGRISGKVFDAQGQPMSKTRLDLTAADQDQDDPNPHLFWAYADENGRYEFKSIPPGRYVLGIRLDGIRDHDFAYPRRYYPDASNIGDAKIFTLKIGERIDGVTFVMPPPLLSRTVEGIVVWPDDRPVPNAMIEAMISDYAYGIAYNPGATNEAGRFSVKLFSGLSYWIKAVVNQSGGRQMHAEPIDIPDTGDIKELKLIVTSPSGNCERCRFRYGPKKKR